MRIRCKPSKALSFNPIRLPVIRIDTLPAQSQSCTKELLECTIRMPSQSAGRSFLWVTSPMSMLTYSPKDFNSSHPFTLVSKTRALEFEFTTTACRTWMEKYTGMAKTFVNMLPVASNASSDWSPRLLKRQWFLDKLRNSGSTAPVSSKYSFISPLRYTSDGLSAHFRCI